MPHQDELDRLAIRSITEAALPHHLTRNKIAKEAGAAPQSSAFKRKFKMYEGKAGRGWKCTEATAAKRAKPRPGWRWCSIRAGVIALPTTTGSTQPVPTGPCLSGVGLRLRARAALAALRAVRRTALALQCPPPPPHSAAGPRNPHAPQHQLQLGAAIHAAAFQHLLPQKKHKLRMG
jgi:hypothetical protein